MWVAFHRCQGVDRFYLYDHFSVDEWRSELEIEIESGVAEVIEWPVESQPQFSAYTDCLKRHRTDTQWIAFIDVDEFLFSPTGRSLPAVLDDFEKYPGVVANWRVYGHGGWKTQPPGLVTESYLIRSSDDDPVNRTVKSIVQPRLTRPLPGTLTSSPTTAVRWVSTGSRPTALLRVHGRPAADQPLPHQIGRRVGA